jgi:hypothetical protein
MDQSINGQGQYQPKRHPKPTGAAGSGTLFSPEFSHGLDLLREPNPTGAKPSRKAAFTFSKTILDSFFSFEHALDGYREPYAQASTSKHSDRLRPSLERRSNPDDAARRAQQSRTRPVGRSLKMNRTIEALAASFATAAGVEALVLAGSRTGCRTVLKS